MSKAANECVKVRTVASLFGAYTHLRPVPSTDGNTIHWIPASSEERDTARQREDDPLTKKSIVLTDVMFFAIIITR